jgi:hypothetical protein
MLKKHMQENAQLKKHQGSSGSSFIKSEPSEDKPKPERKDFKAMRAQRKQNAQTTIEEFNQKFLSDLQDQIDNMFADREKKFEQAVQKEDVSLDTTKDQTLDQTANDDEGKQIDQEVAEKEKLLAGVRQYAINMSSDIKDLLKNEWGSSINSIEKEKKKAENDLKENIQKAGVDPKKLAAIEREHNLKMQNLN